MVNVADDSAGVQALLVEIGGRTRRPGSFEQIAIPDRAAPRVGRAAGLPCRMALLVACVRGRQRADLRRRPRLRSHLRPARNSEAAATATDRRLRKHLRPALPRPSRRSIRAGAMHDLTPEARARLEVIAARHGVSPDAALALLRAIAVGKGVMAQFDHPELGGMGQWLRSGMVMVGDMFDTGLKLRVGALCSELAALLDEGGAPAAEAASATPRRGRPTLGGRPSWVFRPRAAPRMACATPISRPRAGWRCSGKAE